MNDERARLPRDPATGGISLFDLVKPGDPVDVDKLTAALAEFGDRESAQLALDRFTDARGREVAVSTVDLVITTSGGAAFETMVFTDGNAGARRQYTSAQDALAGHAEVVAELRPTDDSGSPTA